MAAADHGASVAVVTGAARGLGRATALALAERGFAVVLVARSTADRPNPVLPGTLEAISYEIERAGGTPLAVPADLADERSAGLVAETTLRHFGRCDVLVNNAAYSPVGPVADLPPSKWRAALMVNVWAPAALTQAFLGGMLRRGAGRILNVGSSSAVESIAGAAPYCVTKSALERLTQAVGAEVAGTGVSTTCIRIDERIATEADSLMAASGIGADPAGSSSTSASAFGRAVAWLAGSDADLNGCVLTLAQLRHLASAGEAYAVGDLEG